MRGGTHAPGESKKMATFASSASQKETMTCAVVHDETASAGRRRPLHDGHQAHLQVLQVHGRLRHAIAAVSVTLHHLLRHIQRQASRQWRASSGSGFGSVGVGHEA